MDVVVLPDEAAVARRGADIALAALDLRASPVLLAATGNSPLGIYAEMARRHDEGEVALERLRVAQLDEYLDLEAGDRRSLLAWAMRAVAGPMGVPDDRVIRLSADGRAPDAAAREYERALAEAGGVDLAILGLGPNGHLGFNEPPSERDAPTRVVELTTESLESSARYWEGDAVPERAVTAGMTVIMAARRVLLVVLGQRKRAILRRLLDDPIGPELPASWLRTHPAATVLADRAAMGDEPAG